MEDHGRVLVYGAAQHLRVGNVAHQGAHACVVNGVGGHHVEQVDLVDGPAGAGQRQRALFEQFAGQALAQESGAAGDQYFHVS